MSKSSNLMEENLETVDVVVVGGGMVGAAAALGLAKQGCSVAVIERHLPKAFDPDDQPDSRVSAISLGSQQLLEELGAWPYIANMRTCVYRRLAVWEEAQCRTEFNAQDAGISHLGHIIENRIIQLGLMEALEAYDAMEWIHDKPVAIDYQDDSTHNFASVHLDDGRVIRAKTVLGADGAQSFVRKTCQIGTEGWRYEQQVLALSVKTKNTSQDITWQRFTPSGPRAFLPLYDGYGSLVWYDDGDKIKYLKSLNESALKKEAINAFPEEVGEFDILDVAGFPLTRMHAMQYVKGRVILLGDAAHTINPLAGQGVNLGFKDVKALLEAYSSSIGKSALTELFTAQALHQFERSRRLDNATMMAAMDFFYHLFSNDLVPLKLLRNAGLAIADKAGPLKVQVMKHAMGI